MKKRKNIDLSQEVITAISIEAAKDGTFFKPKAEQILENYAKPFIVLKKQKEARAKK
jgi:hypothetical protein